MNGKRYEIANVTKITFDVELISVAHAGHVDAVALDQFHCVLVPKHLIIVMMRMTMRTITLTMAMTLMIKLAIKLRIEVAMMLTMTMTMAMIMILLSCSVLVQSELSRIDQDNDMEDQTTERGLLNGDFYKTG